MESRKIVYRETAIIALGEVILTALMVGVFALIGKFDISVLLGAIVGCVVTIGNFFFMAVVVSLAADRAQAQDVEGGKKLLKVSQLYRLLAIGGILAACALSKKFDVIAMVIPLVFVRPILLISEFFRKKD